MAGFQLSINGRFWVSTEDLDILVEFEPGQVPGLDFIAIERELSERLGRRVELVTPKSLIPRIRDQVLASAEPLYSAGSLPN
jgi:predicted nucleotidyltransferase